MESENRNEVKQINPSGMTESDIIIYQNQQIEILKEQVARLSGPKPSKLEPYREGDFRLWDQKFEIFSTDFNWDESRKLTELVMLLQGKAERIVKTRSIPEWTSDSLRKACRLRLCKKKNIPQLVMELHSVRTDSSDNPESIMQKIEAVLNQADTDVNRIRIQRIKFDKFIDMIRENEPMLFYVEGKMQTDIEPDPYKALELAKEYVREKSHQIQYTSRIISDQLRAAGIQVKEESEIPLFPDFRTEVNQVSEQYSQYSAYTQNRNTTSVRPIFRSRRGSRSLDRDNRDSRTYRKRNRSSEGSRRLKIQFRKRETDEEKPIKSKWRSADVERTDICSRTEDQKSKTDYDNTIVESDITTGSILIEEEQSDNSECESRIEEEQSDNSECETRTEDQQSEDSDCAPTVVSDQTYFHRMGTSAGNYSYIWVRFRNKSRKGSYFLVDTGADISILPDRMYVEMRETEDIEPIRTACRSIHTVNNSNCVVRGTVETDIEIEGKVYRQNFYICADATSPIIVKQKAALFSSLARGDNLEWRR